MTAIATPTGLEEVAHRAVAESSGHILPRHDVRTVIKVALASVLALHKPCHEGDVGTPECGHPAHGLTRCAVCRNPYPCDTARACGVTD